MYYLWVLNFQSTKNATEQRKGIICADRFWRKGKNTDNTDIKDIKG